MSNFTLNRISLNFLIQILLSKEASYKIVSTQPFLANSFKTTLKKINNIKIFQTCNSYKFNYLERCLNGKKFSYTDLIASSTFCLIFNQNRSVMKEMTLFDTLKFNCIPVIIADEWILPFSEFLDWTLFSVQLRSFQINKLSQILEKYSENDIQKMKKQGEFVFTNYFASMSKITLGVLKFLESRINRNFNSLEFTSNKKVTLNSFLLEIVK